MRRIVIPFLVIGSLVYTTAAWEATISQNVQITVASGNTSLLPADRDASANWKMAGLLSVGGIPNRTTQCGATINPRGGGQDDTAQIQAAINACPVGQVVQLATGTFTIAGGNYVLLNKAITVRGAGPGSTILQHPTTTQCPPPSSYGAVMDCPYGGGNSEIFHISPVGRFVGNNVTPCALTSDAIAGSYQVTVSSSCASMFVAARCNGWRSRACSARCSPSSL